MQKEEIQKEDLNSLPCPSFNYYFTDQVARITEQVIQDQNNDPFRSLLNDDTNFEFTSFNNTIDDEGGFFHDTVFWSTGGEHDSTAAEKSAAIEVPMERLLTGASDLPPLPSSESSSEADDLERLSAQTYCVWSRNSSQASPNICQKSNSTGSSSLKPWKLLDFLRRSNSEGKGSFMLVTSVKKRKSFVGREKMAPVSSALEALYVRNRASKSVDKIKSFLPYRKNLFGLFGNGYPSL
ncbi:hypothetical protein Lal_00042991 [Lupinus albus]|uniref:Uncharacterized protein n=1 Tax=Lupinus albus TaxID=3870 RepID=A0A6A4PUJ8_LUPAL|nr:hypothetical protein Lalb_Chr10g0093891 [Lupinus albus]KAF1889022.1 hypothetical protein Lal_00042991 [Lupinus albus]